MKVIALQSSPNIDGLTSRVAKAVLQGVKAKGGEIELVHLNKLDISHCIVCDNGWGTCGKKGVCILNDDFENLRKRIFDADAFVFASPVYFLDLSESAKIFLDRLRRCEYGLRVKPPRAQIKKVIGIASAGDSGRGAVRALYLLEEYLRRIGFEIFDLITVTQFSKNHKIKMLENSGRELSNILTNQENLV
jgi:multimeric flavodoxin WrbA